MVKGGINGGSKTHLDIFDISYLNTIPNINYLHPTNKEELLAMLRWALTKAKHPVAIRILSEPVVVGQVKATDFTNTHYDYTRQGEKVAILGLDKFQQLALDTADLLAAKDINATVLQLYSATDLDKQTLTDLKEKHQLIVTLEDASVVGGFGSLVSQFYADSKLKVLTYGAQKQFTDNIPQATLYQEYHLRADLLTKDIQRELASSI